MKNLLCCFVTLLLLSACHQQRGSGNIITEKRQTGDFTGVSVGGAFAVEIKNGPVTEVIVESDDNIINEIETKVSGNMLRIRTKSGSGFNNSHFKVYITAPELNSIKISGAARAKATGELKSNSKISFDVSGAAGITALIDAPEIYAEVSGAGTADLSGRTRDFKAEVSGGGKIGSEDLKSENTDVRASGAGSARVHASVSLKANASGAGNIFYKGGANVQQKTSGAGNVRNEN